MATLIEVLPRVQDMYGNEAIPMIPGGDMNGIYFDGTVNPVWFSNVFPDLAGSELPLPRDKYDVLKAIGEVWLMNTAQWRKDSIFEVEGLTAEDLLDDEEPLLAELAAQRNPQPEEPAEEPTEETPVEEQPVEQPTEEEVPTEEV